MHVLCIIYHALCYICSNVRCAYHGMGTFLIHILSIICLTDMMHTTQRLRICQHRHRPSKGALCGLHGHCGKSTHTARCTPTGYWQDLGGLSHLPCVFAGGNARHRELAWLLSKCSDDPLLSQIALSVLDVSFVLKSPDKRPKKTGG